MRKGWSTALHPRTLTWDEAKKQKANVQQLAFNGLAHLISILFYILTKLFFFVNVCAGMGWEDWELSENNWNQLANKWQFYTL